MPVDLEDYRIMCFCLHCMVNFCVIVFKGIPLYKHVSVLAGKSDVILPVPVSVINSKS